MSAEKSEIETSETEDANKSEPQCDRKADSSCCMFVYSVSHDYKTIDSDAFRYNTNSMKVTMKRTGSN